MLIRIRKLRKSQDGQAIVLAALGCLILAIGVLATVNLGHAIHERIKLQNVADATAYSLAALEARAFNFIAFVNRAQVAHYISAMSFQSILVMVWFIDTMLGVLRDMVSVLAFLACLCIPVPIVGQAICLPVSRIVGALSKILTKLYDAWHKKIAPKIDEFIGKWVIRGYYELNKWGMYGAQKLMKELVYTNVLDSMHTIAHKNDPEINRDLANLGSGALNHLEYRRAFDKKSEDLSTKNLRSSGDIAKVRRVMTEVTNSTRWPIFITNRSLQGVLERIPVVGKALGALMNIIPITFLPTGQTKLTNHKRDKGRCDRRFGTQFDHSQLNMGNVLSGDEVWELKFKLWKWEKSWTPSKDVVSVWAEYKKGEHCTIPRHFKIPTGVCPTFYLPDLFSNPCKGDKKNHPWEGIVRYIKFNPDSKHKYFHQPSTFALLNKSPEDLGGQAYVQNFKFTVGSRSEEIDTNVGTEPLAPMRLLKGINAWSRAMAYYHRPSFKNGQSNWREHPNFFNPFWRAKLAPLGESVSDLVSKIGLGGRFARIFSEELITH
jgi:hypothetical protein